MTHKTVRYIPTKPFLSVRLLAAAFWASWFAIQWIRVFDLGNLHVLMETFWPHLVGAILCTLVTYAMDLSAAQDEDD